jgi:hypothetical protein
VVKYHLGARLPAQNTGLTRDTIFNVFILIFFMLITCDGRSAQRSGARGAELPSRLRPILKDMQADCRSYILRMLQRRMQDNEKPPPIADLIREVEATSAAPFCAQTRAARAELDEGSTRLLDRSYTQYVSELQRRYGHLTCSYAAREE